MFVDLYILYTDLCRKKTVICARFDIARDTQNTFERVQFPVFLQLLEALPPNLH